MSLDHRLHNRPDPLVVPAQIPTSIYNYRILKTTEEYSEYFHVICIVYECETTLEWYFCVDSRLWREKHGRYSNSFVFKNLFHRKYSIFSYLELPFLLSIVIYFPVCRVLPQDEI